MSCTIDPEHFWRMSAKERSGEMSGLRHQVATHAIRIFAAQWDEFGFICLALVYEHVCLCLKIETYVSRSDSKVLSGEANSQQIQRALPLNLDSPHRQAILLTHHSSILIIQNFAYSCVVTSTMALAAPALIAIACPLISFSRYPKAVRHRDRCPGVTSMLDWRHEHKIICRNTSSGALAVSEVQPQCRDE